ncbi:hypothetical protein HBI81_008770 [Parastagonospora nodorum]|nr:hypothetical protein HBI81_008770 [Parastagonospora nodorum]
MFGFLTPKKDNKIRACTALAGSPTSYVAAVTEKRQCAHVSTTTLYPATSEPATISISAFGSSSSPVWHETPHITKTSWWGLERHRRQRPETAKSRLPANMFRHLPREIYDCIIAQLEIIHLDQERPCSACNLRDLHSLSLVSRAWDKATVTPMYRNVLLFANEDYRGTGRLRLLRRTLRDRSVLARQVLELRMPGFQALYQNAAIEQEGIVSLIASLVMACPNLERLVGFNITSSAQVFDRLSHALSTRSRLREKVWMLKDPITDLSDDGDDGTGEYYVEACDPTERFLELNSSHVLLKTLVLHQDDVLTATTLNFRAIVGTLRRLPNLQDLSISGLSESSFTNMTLNALPLNLRSLRLENLPGIDDKGLQRFANSQAMSSIRTLLLIDLEVSNLTTISDILSAHSANLEEFSLAQDKAPGNLTRQSVSTTFQSPTLRYIHWEIRSDAGSLVDLPSTSYSLIMPEPPSPASSSSVNCFATTLLAKSIKSGVFPSLRRIRIPHDPQGLIQALCKPLVTALLPFDMATSSFVSSPTQDGAEIAERKARADSATGSPMTPTSPAQAMLTPTRSRLEAQARILAARKNARMKVRLYNSSNDAQSNRAIGGFVGQVGSQITYDLRPDRRRMCDAVAEDGEERNEWITNIEDLVEEQDLSGSGTRRKLWNECGHRVRGKTVLVEELFRSAS